MAATPTNLSQYFQAKGKPLPSVAQNAQTYAQMGLGTAGSYTGTAVQNNSLLGKLLAGDAAPAAGAAPAQAQAAPAAAPAQPADPTLSIQNTDSQVSSLLNQESNINSTTSLAPYLTAAGNQLNPDYVATLKAYQDAQAVQQQGFANDAAAAQAREPIVRQTYANLAAELTQSQNTETAVASQQGEQNIGSARAQNAAAGISANASGSFAAPVTNQQNILKNAITDISTRYGLKQQDVATQLSGSLLDLTDTINKAHDAGNAALADSTLKMVQLTADHNQAVSALASQMFKADTDQQRLDIQAKVDDLRIQQTQERIDLATKQADIAQQRANIAEQNAQTAESRASVSAATASATLQKAEQANALPTAIGQVSDAFTKNPVVDLGGGNKGNLIESDGYANPQAFKSLLQTFQSQGLTATDFYKNFAQYINPRYADQYGLSAAQLKKLVA